MPDHFPNLCATLETISLTMFWNNAPYYCQHCCTCTTHAGRWAPSHRHGKMEWSVLSSKRQLKKNPLSKKLSGQVPSHRALVRSSIFKQRWLSFMVVNGYLDRMCSEGLHARSPWMYWAINQTCCCPPGGTHKTSLHCCMLLGPGKHLAVSITISSTSRCRPFTVPTKLWNIVASLYCGLLAIVTSSDSTFHPISLKTCVYQGDPFLNTVMCTMADSVK